MLLVILPVNQLVAPPVRSIASVYAPRWVALRAGGPTSEPLTEAAAVCRCPSVATHTMRQTYRCIKSSAVIHGDDPRRQP